MVHQDELGQYSSGFVTGYMLESIDTAVLSIPSFVQYGKGIDTFSTAIGDFIAKAQESGAKKVIIDLQQNTGGQVSLALDVFRWFFPEPPEPLKPFTGSRMRSHEKADALGQTFTSFFQELDPSLPAETYTEQYRLAIAEEWVITDRINADTGMNFTSWAEYYGPHQLYGEVNVSATQTYNMSSRLFDSYSLGIRFPDCYFTDETCSPESKWQAEDIVILTDGLCSSACSLFVELMHQQGVRKIAVSGRPEAGPMQAASGSRGAAAYDSDTLSSDYEQAMSLNETTIPILQTFPEAGLRTTYLGFNLRDQVRPSSTIPNQFLYMPADCRLYWSLQNFNDYSQLWMDAYNGIYNDTFICVQGSTNVTEAPKRNARAKRTAAVRRDLSKSIADHINDGISAAPFLTLANLGNDAPGVQATEDLGPNVKVVGCLLLNGGLDYSRCPIGTECHRVTFPCTDYSDCQRQPQRNRCQGEPDVQEYAAICKARCSGGVIDQCNSRYESCVFDSQINTELNSITQNQRDFRTFNHKRIAGTGYCEPKRSGDGGTSCADIFQASTCNTASAIQAIMEYGGGFRLTRQSGGMCSFAYMK